MELNRSPEASARPRAAWLSFGLGGWLVAAVCVALVVPALLRGQIPDDENPAAPFPWKEMKPAPGLLDPQGKQTRNTTIKLVRDILAGRARINEGNNQRQFDGWFRLWVFPHMTLRERLAYLPDERSEFYKLIRQASDPDGHRHLMQLSLKTLSEIAGENYHPAARHNAMLILGELNDREAQTIGGRAPPDPMRAALPVMLDSLAEPSTPDLVRVAALVGILRHVEYDAARPQANRMPDTLRDRIGDQMLAIVNQPVSADSPDAAGKNWMKRQAIDVLAALGAVGAEGKIFAALDKLVGDDAAPTPLRLTASVALGRLNYPPGLKVDGTQLSAKLASVAVAAVRDEIARIQERAERKIASRPANYSSDEEGGTINEDDQRRCEFAKRRLRQELFWVQQGLIGPTGASGVVALARTGADSGAVADKLQKGVLELQKVAESSETDLELLTGDLLSQSARLEQLLQRVLRPAGRAPAAGPMAPEDLLPP